MALSSVTQTDNLRIFEIYYASLVKATAGASGNTVDINFVADGIIGAPNATISQSGKTVTISGLTNTSVYHLVLYGKSGL